MHVELPIPKCRVCDSQHSETFQQRGKSGRRCLACGHEKISLQLPMLPDKAIGAFTYMDKSELF